MELREGYKNTDVGVIPEDWEVKELGECLLRSPDYGLNAAAAAYDDTLPTYLRITDISEDGRFISSGKASVNNSFAKYYYLENGDIVFARTGASVGKTYLYNENDGKLVFAGFLIRIKPNSEIVDYKYLIYLTQTKTYWDWVSANSMRSGQPGLNSNEYKLFKIPLPPSQSEQTAIATALSDTDALINSLEKLIVKKRNIKQGAMQKLLQTKEGWEERKLGEIATFFSGGTPNTSIQDYYNGEIYWITSGDLNKNVICEVEGRISKEGLNNSSAKMIKKNTLLIALYGATAGVTAISRIEAAINQAVLAIILNAKYSTDFLYYQLSYRKEWIILTYTQGGQPNLSGNIIKSIEMLFPPFKEQTRIATILSDMDSEIQALETKLEKYRKIKLGMMQNLLTGKIRLV